MARTLVLPIGWELRWGYPPGNLFKGQLGLPHSIVAGFQETVDETWYLTTWSLILTEYPFCRILFVEGVTEPAQIKKSRKSINKVVASFLQPNFSIL